MKNILLILLLIAFSFLSPAWAQVEPDHGHQVSKKIEALAKNYDLDSDIGYFQALSALEEEQRLHQGVAVKANFTRFLENPDKYLALLTKKYLFRTDHSERWFNSFAEAAEYAKKGDWSSCEIAAGKGLIEKPDEPVLIFLQAVAHKKLNQNKLSLSDLNHLCSIKENRKIDPDWNKYREQEEREFFDFLLI